MTNIEIVDELTTLKNQFASEIDRIIESLTESRIEEIVADLSSAQGSESNEATEPKSIKLKSGLVLKKKEPVVLTPEERELNKWFDRPTATDDEPRSRNRFWAKFPTVEDAFEHSSSDDFKFLSQLNKAFYAIAYRMLKNGISNGTPMPEIIENIIYEANIFIWCANMESTRGFDEKMAFRFIRNTKILLKKMENGELR